MIHPYRDLPDHCYWARSVAHMPPDEVDPMLEAPFRLTRRTPVLTAGSCFADRITKELDARGYNLVMTERGHPLLPRHIARAHGYGRHAARYGNIYTARQLRQLLERAMGLFEPVEPPWRLRNGNWADPFRPTVQPGGFVSRHELLADRARHLACVRTAFGTARVFIFTLGLTEAWHSLEDGAVFPVAPGVAAGELDKTRHGFVDFSVEEIAADLARFLSLARKINPELKVILTVSPVPLAATARPDRHVLAATTLSKAKLRLAAEISCREQPGVAYFPAYEIVTGPHGRGRHFTGGLRDASPTAIKRVMASFFRHFAQETDAPPPQTQETPPHTARPGDRRRARLFAAACDEVLNDETECSGGKSSHVH